MMAWASQGSALDAVQMTRPGDVRCVGSMGGAGSAWTYLPDGRTVDSRRGKEG